MGDSYSFQDLVKLRKLRDLRANRVSVANIRASVDAMQAVSGMSNPLLEATASRRGSRVLFRHSGAVMEPIARQFVFDFEAPAPGAADRRREHQRQSRCAGIARVRIVSAGSAAGGERPDGRSSRRLRAACCTWTRTTRLPRSIWERSAITGAPFGERRNFTAAPPSPIRDMRWLSSTWATCSTSWSGCPMRSSVPQRDTAGAEVCRRALQPGAGLRAHR